MTVEEARRSHRGACHCGRVTFELQAKLDQVFDCNCSICRRKGALWHAAAEGDLRILTGEPDLVLYQFDTMTAKHYFCRHCGIHPFARPRIDPSRWVVNVRCIEGVDLSTLPLQKFDGENWEKAARDLVERMKRAPAESA